jgi:hypothetical protein
VKAIAKRLCRLEDQFGPADGKPRKTFRVTTQPVGRGPVDLGNSCCQRTLCADGTVCESITLVAGDNGREITEDELEQWVESFPIEVPDGRIRPRRLPPPPAPVE